MLKKELLMLTHSSLQTGKKMIPMMAAIFALSTPITFLATFTQRYPANLEGIQAILLGITPHQSATLESHLQMPTLASESVFR
jgi:hypothetical protein